LLSRVLVEVSSMKTSRAKALPKKRRRRSIQSARLAESRDAVFAG
jgi:hypothetical protein